MLDSSLGKPAEGIVVTLQEFHAARRAFAPLADGHARSHTHMGGRCTHDVWSLG